MSCQLCTDPDGEVLVPYYGVAPHICFFRIPGAAMGESKILPKEEWPDGFMEDPESPGHGTYWCQHCGEGRPTTQPTKEPTA